MTMSRMAEMTIKNGHKILQARDHVADRCDGDEICDQHFTNA